MRKLIMTGMMLAVAVLARAQVLSENGGAHRDWLTSFTAVEVAAPLDIEFIEVPDSVAPKIIYDTKGSYTTRFRAEVRDRVLHITERADSRRTERTSVKVYYNALERISIHDAEARFDRPVRATLLDLEVGGTARFTAQLDVKDLRMELTGKSQATLTGSVRYLSLFVSTATLAASALEVMSADVNATGSASVALWVTDRFQAKTSTGGKITYKGNPPIVRGGTKFMGGNITHIE